MALAVPLSRFTTRVGGGSAHVRQQTMSHSIPPRADSELLAELRHYRKVAAALPHDDVKMDLPEGARLKTEEGAWKVRWQGFTCILGPSSKKGYDQQVEIFNQTCGQYAHLVSKAVTSCVFGAVRGIKHVQVIRDLDSKTVDYALEVPGGFVDVGILKRGAAWDESDWEQFFHTIQMVKR